MGLFKLMNGWTKESVMEQVKKYNNGKRAVAGNTDVKEEHGWCVYRASNGNRCAVGCFIPDNHMALESSLTVVHLLEKYPDLNKNIPFEECAMRNFQVAHDLAIDDDLHQNVHSRIQRFLDIRVE